MNKHVAMAESPRFKAQDIVTDALGTKFFVHEVADEGYLIGKFKTLQRGFELTSGTYVLTEDAHTRFKKVK